MARVARGEIGSYPISSVTRDDSTPPSPLALSTLSTRKRMQQLRAMPSSPSSDWNSRRAGGSAWTHVQVTRRGSSGGAPNTSVTRSPTPRGSSSAAEPALALSTECDERTTAGQLAGEARKRWASAAETPSRRVDVLRSSEAT